MSVENCLLKIQAKLSDIISKRPDFQRPLGAIDALLSAENGGELDTQLSRGRGEGGKNVKYTIEYALPACEEPLDCEEGCGTPAEMPLSDCLDVEITRCKSSKEYFTNIEDWRNLNLLNESDIFASALLSQMNKIADAVEVEAVEFMCDTANAGCFKAGDTTPHLLKLVDGNTGAINWANADIIQRDFDDAGFAASPLLVGGKVIHAYNSMKRLASENQFGVNLAGIPTFPAFYTNKATSVDCMDEITVGNEPVIAFIPGVMNFIQYSKNVGKFATRAKSSIASIVLENFSKQETNARVKTVLAHPTKNLMFDFSLKMKEDGTCQEGIYWSIKLHYDFKALPIVACSDTCFNGVVKYNVCSIPTPNC